MTKSPQFKQAILNNIERLKSLDINIDRSATIQGVDLKDYSKRVFLKNQKSPSIFKYFFLQKVF